MTWDQEDIEDAGQIVDSAYRFEFRMALQRAADRIARERADIDAEELIRQALKIRDGEQ